jgi:hypothetical protein
MTPEMSTTMADTAATNDIALDYTALRARLASTSGPQYWRSLEELAGTQEIDALVHRNSRARPARSWIPCRVEAS